MSARQFGIPRRQAYSVEGGEDYVLHVDINPEHQKALAETEKNNVKCFPKYRTMVAEFIRWLAVNYPDTYDEVVYELTDEQRADPNRFYHTATHDIIFPKFESKWLKFFISDEKKWKDEARTIQYSYDHPRRYHDAILKCCEVSDYQLHPRYRPEMKAFLDNLKAEKAEAKSNNQLTENDSDEIGLNLVETLCSWCVACGSMIGIFVWAFLVTQWNLMGRTVNVDPLGFHNFRKEDHDCIVIEFDRNKKDRKGEKTTPKTCYANPARPFISMFLALGIYLSVYQTKFSKDDDKIFQRQGTDGTASKSYAKALKKIIDMVSSLWNVMIAKHILTFHIFIVTGARWLGDSPHVLH